MIAILILIIFCVALRSAIKTPDWQVDYDEMLLKQNA
jgi:hypothetical protein